MDLEEIARAIHNGAKRIDIEINIAQTMQPAILYEVTAYKMASMIRIDLKPKES